MIHTFYINLYIDYEPSWLSGYEVKKKTNQLGDYLVVCVYTEKDKTNLVRKLKKHHIRYQAYEKRWERSSNYRKLFFAHNQPPFRCRYCNKPLTRKQVVVDHIYPVSKGKKNIDSRMLLYLRGISDVNDIKNLAPCCYRCNQRKQDKLGLWYLRGILGKYRAYWITKRIIYFSILFLLCYLIFQN